MDPRNRQGEGYRALMAAYREGERMPAHVRAAGWERLQRELTGTGEETPRAARRGDWIWGAAVLAAAVALLILDQRRQLLRTRDSAGSQAAHDAGAGARDTTAIEPPPLPAATANPGTAEEPAAAPPLVRPRSKPQRARGPAASTPAYDIDAELALLEAARTALRARAPVEALTHLAEHARRFSAGALVEERMRLEVEAWCGMGQRDRARTIAEALQTTFPRSSHLPAVATLCAE